MRRRAPWRSPMPERVHRVVAVTGVTSAATTAALVELAALRGPLGLELLMTAEEAARHDDPCALGYGIVDEAVLRTADVCVVFGGDGTILRALGRLLGSGVPTLGVNFGNVGFLASLPHEAWRDGLAEMVEGRYSVAELLTVEARLGTRHYTAVNDIVLSRTESRGVLHLQY